MIIYVVARPTKRKTKNIIPTTTYRKWLRDVAHLPPVQLRSHLISISNRWAVFMLSTAMMHS